jgi:hypothetical protein
MEEDLHSRAVHISVHREDIPTSSERARCRWSHYVRMSLRAIKLSVYTIADGNKTFFKRLWRSIFPSNSSQNSF